MEAVSKTVRLSAAAELLVVVAVMLAVREWGRANDIIGAGSIGVLSAVAVGTVIMKLRGVSWMDMGLRPPASKAAWFKTVGLAILLIIATVGLIFAVVFPILGQFFDRSQFSSDDTFSFLFGRPFFTLFYIIAVAWIGAAFGEEMFSRGIMMNRLAEIFGDTRAAWAIALFGQAAFFGLAHAYQGIGGIFLTGSIGLIFGAFYLILNRNLWPLILAHGTIDTISVVQLYLGNPVN